MLPEGRAQSQEPLRDDFFKLCCFFDFMRASLAPFFLVVLSI
jgi:hypothetical protein